MKSILLIDDDNDEYQIFREALLQLSEPLSCSYESEVEIALIKMCNKKYDFIFVDMNMPKVNGIECTKRIRMFKEYKDVPIIIYSTYVTETILEAAINAGATHYMEKPYSISELGGQLTNFFSGDFENVGLIRLA